MRPCLHLIIIGAQLSGKPVGQGWPRVKPRCRSGLTKKFRHFPVSLTLRTNGPTSRPVSDAALGSAKRSHR